MISTRRLMDESLRTILGALLLVALVCALVGVAVYHVQAEAPPIDEQCELAKWHDAQLERLSGPSIMDTAEVRQIQRSIEAQRLALRAKALDAECRL